MLTRIDHIGIACFDLDKTVEFYRATYGFEVFHSEVNEEQGVREAMLKTLKLPNTGMAIRLDIGDPKNIHPTNKQEVGRRLAQWALGSVYGKKVETSGPLPASLPSSIGQ